MGEVRVKVKLTNAVDQALVRRELDFHSSWWDIDRVSGLQTAGCEICKSLMALSD